VYASASLRSDRRPLCRIGSFATGVDPESIVPAVRQAIWSLDKDQPLARIQTMARW
jgi:hypothetical protein